MLSRGVLSTKDAPFDSWVRIANLPCCTFVACFLRECLAPGKVQPPSVDAYASQDRVWWELANVWDPSQPWSALEAARALWGGPEMRYASLVGKDQPAPALRFGWNVVQRWKQLDEGESPSPDDDSVVVGVSTGHTYLAYRFDHEVTIYQSSTSRGYRCDQGTWEGTAGLDGYAVAVQPI